MENNKIEIDIEEYNKLLVIKTKYDIYYNRLKASNEKIVDKWNSKRDILIKELKEKKQSSNVFIR